MVEECENMESEGEGEVLRRPRESSDRMTDEDNEEREEEEGRIKLPTVVAVRARPWDREGRE
jgi:hypothetical protein